MKKFICRNCGVVNEANDATLTSSDDWLECTLPTGFEWCLPAGKITPVVGEAIYISGNGEHLTQDAYIDKYMIDPELAYNLMRGKVQAQTADQLTAGMNLTRGVKG
ncbi:MAG: hypothetical protein WAW52_10575 [Methanothrix sp.]